MRIKETVDQYKPLAVIAMSQVANHTGAPRVVFAQVSALRAIDCTVIVLAEKGDPKKVAAHGARLQKLRRSWLVRRRSRRFWFNRKVQDWCADNRPDLLVSHGGVVSDDVVTMHNCVYLACEKIEGMPLSPDNEVAAIHDFVLQRNNQARIVVNSRMMGDELRKRYNIPATRLELIYPGYDPNQFNPQHARAERQKTRQALGVAPDEKLIGLITSGGFRKRNVDGFIRIAQRLSQQSACSAKLKFLVVGKDDPRPYQAQCCDAGLKEHFIWCMPRHDVEKFYGALDIFLLPAHLEEFGLVVLEAMACGTPVLVSRRVGAAELLESSHSELIVATDDTQAWAERIDTLLRDETQLRTLGAELAHLATRYSHDHHVEKLKASFKSIIDTRRYRS